MGFIPDIERIFSLTPFTRQTLFFSATMAPEIERITNTFLSAPARVEVARQATASETIEQGVVMIKATRRDRADSEKRAVLRALVDGEGEACTNAIVFCNRKIDVDVVAKSLKKYGYDAAPIHGDLDQSQRTRTLDQFRAGELKILVASDVAARGLDVPAVSHVFNYDVPSHAEDYVHRIGRTGRAGRSGKAMMICNPRDEKNFAAIEALIQKEIPRIDNPVKSNASDAPAEADVEDKPAKPSRSRSRTVSRKKPDTPQEAPVEAQAETPKAEPKPEAKSQDKPQDKPQDRGQERSQGRGRSSGSGRSGGGRGGDQGHKVVGMGDHMPSFIALSFDERRVG